MPYGSTGNALLESMQQSMLQRQVLQRQAMLDAMQKRKDESAIAAQTENVATNKMLREAQATKLAEDADKSNLTQAIGGLSMGASVDPSSPNFNILQSHGMLTTPTPRAPIADPADTAVVPPALAMDPGAVAPAAPKDGTVPPALAKPESPTFTGTTAQQLTKKQADMLRELAKDPATAPELRHVYEMLATTHETGVKVPDKLLESLAGLKSDKPETAIQHQMDIEAIMAKPEASRTPDEVAKLKANEKYRTAVGTNTFNLNQPFKEDQAVSRYYTTQQAAVDRLRTPISQQMERAHRTLDNLAHPGQVADSIVAPEFLSVMAGGFGTGLRMSEAELSRINMSQNHWAQLVGEFNKWKTGSNPVIQPAMRAEMQMLLQLASDRADKKLALYDDYLAQMAESKSTSDMRAIAAKLRAEDSKLTTGDPEAYGYGKAAGNHGGAADATVPVATPAPAGGGNRIYYDSMGNQVQR